MAHQWRFFRSGGFDQVRLDKIEDWQHLPELDPKLWAALSCPVKGLEFDERTLSYLDSDADGKVRIDEVRSAVRWALSVLKQPAVLLSGEELPLSAINDGSEDGRKLLASAQRMLTNLGKAEASALTVADTADMASIFPPDQLNGDGVISIIEQSVSGIDLANPQLVNYGWAYNSYSVGANYQFNNDWAMFGRVSKGGRANADRLLFGKVNADGSVAREDAIDQVKQYELGSKSRHGNLNLFATLFFAETDEQNFEATTQRFFDRVYQANGIELESSYRIGDLDLRGSITWTDAEISKDALNPELVGNTPRRQADVIYNLLARYTLDQAQFGVSLIGTSAAYAQDNNDLKFGAYTQVNAFASYELARDLTVSLNINNLFDKVGLTEAEQGSVPANGIITARTINGRTASVGLRYQF